MNTRWIKRFTYRALLNWMALVLGMTLGSSVMAQTDPGSMVQKHAKDWVLQTLSHSATQAVALRYEVTVGELDRRLKLAPCSQVEYYVPAGARLWGNARLAMRCGDGVARWNVTLPVKVKAMGMAWVVRNPIPVGAEIRERDVVEAEIDWAEESAPVLADRSQWVGTLAARPLNTGVVLRQGAVKVAQAFQAGAQVRVVTNGIGFQVSAEALALSAGVVGQIARVKMDNGRVASGTVLDARTVRMDL